MLGDPVGFVGSCARLDLGAILHKEAEELLSGQAGARDHPALRCVLLLQVPDAFGKRAEFPVTEAWGVTSHGGS